MAIPAGTQMVSVAPHAAKRQASSILLIEDNRADAALVRGTPVEDARDVVR
jgi:hypothetical protein